MVNYSNIYGSFRKNQRNQRESLNPSPRLMLIKKIYFKGNYGYDRHISASLMLITKNNYANFFYLLSKCLY